MRGNNLKRRSRPLSPIVEELVSHYESKCGSSVHDEIAELPENTEETGTEEKCIEEKGLCRDSSQSPEQCMELEEGVRWYINNEATAPVDNREVSSADEAPAEEEEQSEVLAESAKKSGTSRAKSSEGLAQLNHGNKKNCSCSPGHHHCFEPDQIAGVASSSQKVGQWLQIVDSQELDDPELASPFVEWCPPRPDLSQLPTTPHHRSTAEALDEIGKPGNSPKSEKGPIAASSSNYSISSEPEEYDSSNDVASSSPSPLRGDELALVRKPSRIISPRPKLRRKKRDVHIHLSLTDSQLEKMASIFASSQNHPGQEADSPSPDRRQRHSSYKPSSGRSRKNAPKTLHHKEGSSSLGVHIHRKRPSADHGHNKYDYDQQYGSSTDNKSPEEEGGNSERPWSEIMRAVSRSSSQGKASPTKPSSRTRIPVPAQKDKRRPEPLNLADARKYGEIISQRKKIEVIHNPVPGTPAFAGNNDGSSSVYTSDPPTSAPPVVSPLHIKKRTADIGRKLNVLKAYNDYKEKSTPTLDSAILKSPFRSKSATVADMKQGEPEIPDISTMPTDSISSPQHSQGMRPGIPKSATTNDLQRDAQPEPFTPLTPFLLASSVHIKKNLFGEHGWLKDTSAPEGKPEPQKNIGFFGGLKKVARDLAEKADFKNTSSRPRSKTAFTATSPRRQPGVKRLAISLDPREQSLLYCELEYTLSNALDMYIKTQLNGGRLDPAKLKKISDSWAAKGRPRVIGFRYDLETQVELVRLHLYQFRFYHQPQQNQHHHETLSGGAEESTTAIDGILYAVKCNARVMRVRSLCQPDSVIAKHVLDAQALLGLLGAAEGLHRSLAEVSQFFKVVVERERAVRRTREASIRALPHEVAATMGGGHDGSGGGGGLMMPVVDDKSGDVSFQPQHHPQHQQRMQREDGQQQNKQEGYDDGDDDGDDDKEDGNYEGRTSRVPLQYQQQMVSTAAQRQSSQQQQQQQKVSFVVPSFSNATTAAGTADTSLAEQSEGDLSMVRYPAPPPPPPKQLGNQGQQQQPSQADDSLVTLSSKTYRAAPGERSFL